MSLTAAELQHLYSQPGLESYKPQAVLAHLADGSVVAALCYNLVESTARCEANPEYAMKLARRCQEGRFARGLRCDAAVRPPALLLYSVQVRRAERQPADPQQHALARADGGRIRHANACYFAVRSPHCR